MFDGPRRRVNLSLDDKHREELENLIGGVKSMNWGRKLFGVFGLIHPIISLYIIYQIKP